MTKNVEKGWLHNFANVSILLSNYFAILREVDMLVIGSGASISFSTHEMTFTSFISSFSIACKHC